MTLRSVMTIATVAFCCSLGVVPASADRVPITGGGLQFNFSFDGSGVSEFKFVSNGWTIRSTYPIGGDASVTWDNFCTGCESPIVPPGALVGGTISWTPEFGPDAMGTVYGIEFPSSIHSNEDEYGTLLLLPDLTFTFDPFYIPQQYTGEPATLGTTFRVSGALEGRDLRTDRSFVFRDAVTGHGRATFEFVRGEEAGFSSGFANLAFDPTETAPVPEPASILLSLTGLAAIGRRAWKHRQTTPPAQTDSELKRCSRKHGTKGGAE